MMEYKITNGAVTIGDKTILEEINIDIKHNDKVAIIGRNGAGKSTLLKAIIDNDYLEEGTGEEKFNVFKNGVGSLGFLEQHAMDDSELTVLEEIQGAYKELIAMEKRIERLEKRLEEGASAQEIQDYTSLMDNYKLMGGFLYKKEYLLALEKFGFTSDYQNRLVRDLSGGERTKVAFLKLILSKPDILLLDEPTNNLDLEAIEWLEEYLKNYKKALVIVSHDRMFMNKVVNKIYEIEYGKTESYVGNYDMYEKEKRRRYEATLKSFEMQQQEIKRLKSIADRFRYKPSKASMAMAKLKQIERMKLIDKPEKNDDKTINIKWTDFKESAKIVLTVEDLEIGYNDVLSKVSFQLCRGEKLAIIGGNGQGKSTLLKTIMGYVKAISGSIELGKNVEIGYFDQKLETLNKNNTIYEEFSASFPQFNDFQVRSALASFLFYSEDIDKKINVLSGGEKVRLELAKIIYAQPNFLILDEPTNHLDIKSREKLESILKSYAGTVLFVSHDRYFVQKVADSLLVFQNKRSDYYRLTYQEYMDRKKDVLEVVLVTSKVVKKKGPKDIKEKSKNIKALEREITKREEQVKSLKQSLFEEDVYSDYERVQKINLEIEKLEEEILNLMTEWESFNN